jgi:hypothetical protein
MTLRTKADIRNLGSRARPFKGAVAVVTLAALLLLSGCFDPPSSSVVAPPNKVVAAASVAAPLKVGVMSDKTASAGHTRTPQLAPDDLNPLIELVCQRGGELGVGLVTDYSNNSLVRLRVETPPAPPREPTKEEREGNAFDVAHLMDSYKAERAKYEEVKKQRDEEVGRRVEEFRAAVSELLARKPDARRSDVWGALRRAELFLSESDVGWAQPTHRYLLLVSDAQDNAGQPRLTLKSGAQLLIVNGSASLGSIASLNPQPFESPAAAFHHIVAAEGGQQ